MQSVTRLIKRMARAQLRLEQLDLRKLHADSCPESDQEAFAPCNCGATAFNQQLDALNDELDPEKP